MLLRYSLLKMTRLYGEMLKYHLSLNPDNEVYKFETGAECLRNLHQAPSLISLDYSLPDISGFEVIKKVKQYNDEIPIVIVSGQEDVATAVKLLKRRSIRLFCKR